MSKCFFLIFTFTLLLSHQVEESLTSVGVPFRFSLRLNIDGGKDTEVETTGYRIITKNTRRDRRVFPEHTKDQLIRLAAPSRAAIMLGWSVKTTN